MTKKSAFATAKHLDVRCNEPYLFAVKVGKGCVTSSRCQGDSWALLTLFVNLIEKVMEKLNTSYHADFRKLLIHALLNYLKAEPAPDPPETLSDKQRDQRIRDNEEILQSLEAIL